MKRTIISLIALVSAATALTAQNRVVIGERKEPKKDARLEIINPSSGTPGGVVLPYVSLVSTDKATPLTAETNGNADIHTHLQGMIVYNTANAGAGMTAVSPGLYYNDGTKWYKLEVGGLLETKKLNWFYMPAISFDTSMAQTNIKRDLYQAYKSQFTGSTLIKSVGAPATIPCIPAATDLYYYITDYDSTVFENISIDASGVMTYSVKPFATECSYMNVVFVLK